MNMKREEVEKILAAYYDGRTTGEEETALKHYFETHEVPEHMRLDKELFLSFRNPCRMDEARIDALEARLARMIDEKAEEEKRFLVRNKSARSWKWIGGVAASLLLLIALSFGIMNLSNQQPKDTFTDPKDAHAALQSIFMEMSATMNEGISQLAESRKEVSKVNQEIKEEIYN